jgi:hypothetical protein
VNGPVETKVRVSTTASTVLGLVLAVMTWVQDSPDALGNLPKWLQGALLLVVPPLVTFVSGYLAAHTARTDLNAGAHVPLPPAPPAP